MSRQATQGLFFWSNYEEKRNYSAFFRYKTAVTLAGAALLASALAACQEEIAVTAPIRPVKAVVVQEEPGVSLRSFSGDIRPKTESPLGFRIAGKITQRIVDVGSAVMKGDLLAQLDDQDYRNKAASAETDIAAAQAVLIEARAAEGRLGHLLENGNTTRANYDVALKNLRSAEAKL
ncbi:MAG: biotin/lipoyl-binding protein, partial [Rhodomicrobium sp.]|nr:biotin/lipoyl-binding protein [Rhodomicrobium sp.]